MDIYITGIYTHTHTTQRFNGRSAAVPLLAAVLITFSGHSEAVHPLMKGQIVHTFLETVQPSVSWMFLEFCKCLTGVNGYYSVSHLLWFITAELGRALAVVKVTLQVNGNSQILGVCPQKTMGAINIKSGTNDYVGEGNPHAKFGNSGIAVSYTHLTLPTIYSV